MLGLEGSYSASTGVLKEEGSQHGVAGAEKSGYVEGCGLGREADEEGKSGSITYERREREREEYMKDTFHTTRKERE